MSEWSRRGLISASSVFVTVGLGLGFVAGAEAESSPVAITLAAAAIVIASLIGVATSSSGNRFTMGVAVAAATPLVLGGGQTPDLAGSLSAYGFGLAGVWAMRLSRGEEHVDVLPVVIRRLCGFSAYAAVYTYFRERFFEGLTGGWDDLLPFVVAAAAWLLVEVFLRASLTFRPRDLSHRYLALSALQDFNVFLSLVATGALFGEIFVPVGWWALPIAVMPYLFAHSAFRRFQETKVTYKQTIRALARIPEVSGLGVDGHADRTTSLAVAVGRDMGLSPFEVEDLEYAGLMHDIGRVSLNEPNILKMGYTDDDIARWSAEIIAEAPYLDRIAASVRNQYEPYRRPGQENDPELSAVSRIIRVVAAYDWLVHRDGESPLGALETLHQGISYAYDPAVVSSLRRVLEYRGVLNPVRV